MSLTSSLVSLAFSVTLLISNFIYLQQIFDLPDFDIFAITNRPNLKDVYLPINIEDVDKEYFKQMSANYILSLRARYLNDKLPKFDADVVFDTYEVANWKKEYEPVIKQFTELGIGDVIEEWATERKNVFSCGILYFKNEKKWTDNIALG